MVPSSVIDHYRYVGLRAGRGLAMTDHRGRLHPCDDESGAFNAAFRARPAQRRDRAACVAGEHRVSVLDAWVGNGSGAA